MNLAVQRRPQRPDLAGEVVVVAVRVGRRHVTADAVEVDGEQGVGRFASGLGCDIIVERQPGEAVHRVDPQAAQGKLRLHVGHRTQGRDRPARVQRRNESGQVERREPRGLRHRRDVLGTGEHRRDDPPLGGVRVVRKVGHSPVPGGARDAHVDELR